MSIVEIKNVELSEESIASLAFKRSDEESVRVAKALERGSVHPIAKATVNYIGNGDNSSASHSSLDVKNYKVEHGKGVEGEINGEVFRFGTASWALECRRGNNSSEEEKVVARATEEHRSAGEAIAVLCSSSSPDATVFRYSDAPRDEAKDAVDTLRKRGQTVRMLTGDATASALAIAEQVGIEPAAVFSQLTPDKKLAHVESAREDGKKEENGKVVSVAMIGDGINDAPALAAADVGIAVCSTPSDAASSAADVLLLQTGQGQLQSKDTVGGGGGGSMSVISAVPELFALGRMTRNILQQNIFLAICSILGSALPALFGAFPLWLAVCVHEGATLLVAVNSTRLLATFGPRNSMRLSKRVKFLIVTLTLVGIFGALGTVFKPQGVMLQTLISEAVTAAVAESSVAFHSFFHPVLKSAWAGLFAGGLHTLTGADHLAALTPLSVGPSRAKNALLGALWGSGHNTGQIIFGLLFMLLRNRIPWNTEIIGQWGQAIVGLTLIFIGCLGFWEQISGGHGHSHAHSHGGHTPTPSHGSSDDSGSRDEVEQSQKHQILPVPPSAPPRKPSRISWTYITGTIHGLQPDSLFLLLPALTLPKLEAYSFLGSFFFGTIIAMGGYTACLGAGTTLLGKRKSANG